MLRRDFLMTATAAAAVVSGRRPWSAASSLPSTAALPAQARETPAVSKANFADVNGQHIFYSVHDAGRRMGGRRTRTGRCTARRRATTWPP